ncbi:MAG: FAD-dependent oxidoreductase [Actinomycetota bacterium]|nr:FAD-dependent oxidoreductase [Actinomycetota bacterium]
MTDDLVVNVVVIGAGPTGTTCAHQLATRGHSVLLLEKERHPRFKIGESLLPYGTELFDQLGVLDQIERGTFVGKGAVEIADTDGGYFRTYFSSLNDGQKKFGFNVERAPLDAILARNAQGAGAMVVQEAAVCDLVFEGDRVVGVAYDHQGWRRQARARLVLDASGRAGVIARRLRLRQMNARLNNVAVFQHFDGVRSGVNASDEGDLVLSTHDDGWVWCIPIGEGSRSVGAVMAARTLGGRDRREVFEDHLARVPLVNGCLPGAKPRFDTCQVESDFCYHSERLAGPGWMLVGDAGCFVDPIFSGGVFLGMACAMRAAELSSHILGGASEAEAASQYESFCKTGYDHYFRLVYAFYERCAGNVECLFRQLFAGQFKALLHILAGDLWGEERNPVWAHLRADAGYDTFAEPFERTYGCPVYTGAAYRPEVEPVAERSGEVGAA